MDYVKVILKRKRLILVMFLGAAIAAAVLSFITPKVYKITTSLEVGQAAGEAVEASSQLVEKIKSDVYGIFIREKLGISEEKYPKIKTENPKDTRLISLTIESTETQQAKNILEGINNLILGEHQEKIKIKKELIEQDIKTTEGKIKLVESDTEKVVNKIKITESDIEKTKNKFSPINEDIKRIENKIVNGGEEKKNLEAKVDALQKVLVYEQTPGDQFALFDTKEKLANKKQEIEDLYSRINSLKIEIENLNLTINSLRRGKEDLDIQINSLNGGIANLNSQINTLEASLSDIKPTDIIKAPAVSENPIKPRPVLNIVIAGILGILAGIFCAFGKEWWENNKLKV